jgi:hypothetical protein
LHADEGEIRGGAENRAEAARGEARARLLRQRQRRALVLFLQEVDDLRVDAEARRRVRRLMR